MKKTRGRIKSGFYKGFVDETELKRKIEKDAKKSGKTKINILKILFEITTSLLRIVGYIVLFFLSSVGLTALINEEIRLTLLSLIS